MNAQFKTLVTGFVAGLLVMALVWATLGSSGDSGTEVVISDPSTGDQISGPGVDIRTTTMSDLPVMSVIDLPPEAIDTLRLIDDGGPFPFDRDDGVFQNREGLLPERDVGHYREYTVITPGSPDRGARRIVSGEDGERYYTADHYNSFHELVS